VNCRLLGMLVSVCLGAGLALGSEMANAQNLLTDLGPGAAYAINDSGQVVLSIGDSSSQFPLSTGIWSNGTVTAFPPGFVGLAINSGGEVAGYLAGIALYGAGTEATVYSNGMVTNIGVNFDLGEGFASAEGLNNEGDIVGDSPTYASDAVDAFIDINGLITILSTFPGNSQNEIGMPTSGCECSSF
jgi:hypothetical protein